MTFTALTGAVSHFAIGGAPDWTIFLLCVVFTFLWARIASVFANKATPKTLNRANRCHSCSPWHRRAGVFLCCKICKIADNQNMLTNMPTGRWQLPTAASARFPQISGHSHTCLTSLNSVPIIQSLTILGILHA